MTKQSINKTNREIGLRLGRAMDLKNKKQDDVAKVIGVARSTVGNWRRGERPIPACHIAPICELLNISPDVLIMGESFQSGLTKEEVKLLAAFRKYPDRVKTLVVRWLDTFSRNLN